jgi:hypothetical protein
MPPNARWIVLLLVGASALAWFFAGRGPVGTPSHAPCFSNRECQKGESCVVVPKDDGFATQGVCGEACRGDEACPNGWRCSPVSETSDGFFVPANTRGAPGARIQVCTLPLGRR